MKTMHFILKNRSKRGSVLVMVVVSLVLMALLGAAFLQNTRLQRMLSYQADPLPDLDIVQNSILALISQTLADDLRNDGDFAARFSPYDYPWTNFDSSTIHSIDNVMTGPATRGTINNVRGGFRDDRWLASTMPVFPGGTWEHITNLQGYFVGGSGGVADLAGGFPTVFPVNMPGNNANSDTNIPITSPMLVDATGDGIGDSRWTWAPLQRIGNTAYVMAVRIVDLSGMVNVNTAIPLFDQTVDAFASRWHLPTEVDFGTFVEEAFRPEVSASNTERDNVIAYRFPTGLTGSPPGWEQRKDAWEEAARYLPDEGPENTNHQLYRLRNEYELRHRGGLNNIERTDIPIKLAGDGMPVFLRGGATETSFSDVGTEEYYFTKNPRHFLTTHSASAIFAPPRSLTAGAPDFHGPLNRRLDLNTATLDSIRDRIRDVFAAGSTPVFPGSNRVINADNMADMLTAHIADYARPYNTAEETYLTSVNDFAGLRPLPVITEVVRQRRYQVEHDETLHIPPGRRWFILTDNELGDTTGYAIEVSNTFDQDVNLNGITIRIGDFERSLAAFLGGDSIMDGDSRRIAAHPAGYGDAPEDRHITSHLPAGVVTNPDAGRIAAFSGTDPVTLELLVELRDTDGISRGRVVYQRLQIPGLSNSGLPVGILSDDDDFSESDFGAPDSGPPAGSLPFSNESQIRLYRLISNAAFGSGQNFVPNFDNRLDAMLVSAKDFRDRNSAQSPPQLVIANEPNPSNSPAIPRLNAERDRVCSVLNQPSKRSPGSGWTLRPASRIDADEQQIVLAFDNFRSPGELAHIAMLGPVRVDGGDDLTIADVFEEATGKPQFVTDPTNAIDVALTLGFDPSVHGVMVNPEPSDVTRPFNVPHAAVLIDQFTTVDPASKTSGSDTVLVPGLININTAPREVLMWALPWPGLTPAERGAIADQIIARRQSPVRTFNVSDPSDFTDDRGFAYIGELFDWDSDAGRLTNFWDGSSDTAALATPSGSGSVNGVRVKFLGDDSISGDRYESMMIPRWLTGVATTRSDTFAAYIRIQSYDVNNFAAGPLQGRRLVVIFRRSVDEDDDIEVQALMIANEPYFP